MIVAGVGFRRSAGAEEIVALVRRALEEAGVLPERLTGLATLASLAEEPAFREAAARLGVPALAVSTEEAREVEARLHTRSERSLAAHGVGSVAEAAALTAAGEEAGLLLPRIASAGATCALAGKSSEAAGRVFLPRRSRGRGTMRSMVEGAGALGPAGSCDSTNSTSDVVARPAPSTGFGGPPPPAAPGEEQPAPTPASPALP